MLQYGPWLPKVYHARDNWSFSISVICQNPSNDNWSLRLRDLLKPITSQLSTPHISAISKWSSSFAPGPIESKVEVINIECLINCFLQVSVATVRCHRPTQFSRDQKHLLSQVRTHSYWMSHFCFHSTDVFPSKIRVQCSGLSNILTGFVIHLKLLEKYCSLP